MSETKQTKYRPMTFDSLRVHASKLPLEQKVQFVKELKESIDKEVANLQQQANSAHSIASQLNGATVK